MAYASKYYDPAKAHAYYMKNRELKGYADRYGGHRGNGTSAASSNEWDNYKEESDRANYDIDSQITSNSQSYTINNAKNKAKYSKDKANRDNQISSIQDQIQKMRDKLSLMSPEDRKLNRDNYKSKIDQMQKQIKGLRNSQRTANDSYRISSRNAKLAEADAAQELKMKKKGGSTSGFNQKGKEAANMIKTKMIEERNEMHRKTNKKVDKHMLDKVRKLGERIKAAKANGGNYTGKEFGAALKSLLNDTKKFKSKVSSEYKTHYKVKYRKEIDNLRQDKSMYTYYDKRAEKLKRYKEDDKRRAKQEKLRRKREQQREKIKAERERLRRERSNR